MFTSITARAISFKPKKWDKTSNLARLEELIRRAARQQPKPDLIVAPESLFDGYVVYDVIENPALAPRLLELAEPVNGRTIRHFRRLARTLKTCLCFGFAERIGRNIYNAGIFIDQNGLVCGKYHKMQFEEGHHPSWSFNRMGAGVRAFNTPLGRAGIVICNDRWNPAIARTLALDGARLLLIPAYGDKSGAQNKTVLARARENGAAVVEANVGLNLLISKGEIVGSARGNDKITTATIEIPVAPSTAAARASERAFLKTRGPAMAKRYREKWGKKA